MTILIPRLHEIVRETPVEANQAPIYLSNVVDSSPPTFTSNTLLAAYTFSEQIMKAYIIKRPKVLSHELLDQYYAFCTYLNVIKCIFHAKSKYGSKSFENFKKKMTISNIRHPCGENRALTILALRIT